MAQKIQNLTFIIQTLGMGGAEVFLTDLMTQWQQQGVSVKAWVTYPRFRAYLREHGVSVERLPTVSDVVGNWKGLLKAVIFLPYAVLWYGWVIWHSRNSQALVLSGFSEKILVGLVAGWLGRPIIWFEFGPMTALLNKFGGLPKWLYQLVVNTPRLVIVPSENTRQHLLRDGLIAADKIVVIPCGRTVPSVVPKPESLSTPPTVVCVSRLEPGKGQDYLVRAWPAVLKVMPQAHLLIVGEGDFDTRIQAEVNRLRLENSVSLLGRVPDAMAVLNTATVCVFPSVWELEGFGMVTIEAMALAKPIVAFATGPTPEIIEDGISGLLVKPESEGELSAAIVSLLKNAKLRKKLGQAAQRRFHAHYTIQVSAQQYLQAVSKALSL